MGIQLVILGQMMQLKVEGGWFEFERSYSNVDIIDEFVEL